ncbi:TIM-barrel domain-containing protein [uncultured Ferrimonas sp.]|uniref:glycoside hydrolase family 31 protein n=1 Tax=uncultured Ferrimonas sp. TaxID=432640 RepID=UPI0026343F9B|nr:TIM-barrel domain-containing protein [uncultured Ferrimonas sp.]
MQFSRTVLGACVATALTLPTLALPALAATVSGHQLSQDGSTLTLQTDEGQVALRAIGKGTIAVDYRPEGLTQLPSFAVAEDAPKGQGQLSQTAGELRFALADISALVSTSPLRIRFVDEHNQLLTSEAPGLVLSEDRRGFQFSLSPEERLLGGGQRVVGMDRRGQRLPLYNKASYGYTTHAEQMYYGLSAVMSDRKYALVFDNSASGWLDIGKTDAEVLAFEAMGGRTSYLISAGEDYPELLSNYTAAVGRQPLPPRWALGNFASRFGYHNEQEARDVVASFREQDIPLDAIVLDLYWFGKDVKGHMGNLAWDHAAWPTPAQMIADFKQQGVNTVVITEPFVLTSANRWQEAVDAKALATTVDAQPQTFDFYFGNTGLVDVFSNNGQQWFWQAYQRLLADGVSGWWGDLGEPEVHPAGSQHQLDSANLSASGDEIHNAYGHQWAKMVFDGLQQAQPDQRPMIMMRSGFVGSQRYGMIPWTGDVSRSWGGLKPQVELSLQMGMLGLGYNHSDLGGFAGGEVFNPELYLRWLQYGVFQPVYRPHAQENIAPEPIFHDGEVKRIVRDYIKLRYRLLPYIYTMAYQNSSQGVPLMRPLLMDQTELFDVRDAYRFGDALVVAPVTDAAVTHVSFDLPKGIYFDFFSGKRYVGGSKVLVPVTQETIPVLVQAGSFVPMVAAKPSTKQYSSAELELNYYFDPSAATSSGMMYEDDGVDPNAIANGQHELLQFKAKAAANGVSIHLQRQGGDYPGKPEQRQLTLKLQQLPEPQRLLLDGKPLSWQRDGNAIVVQFDWADADKRIEASW